MPGYEPFLLCDFHVHTTWSDGRLSIREVVDLYGRTGRFDVIAITDHILMKRDLLGRMGRLASFGLRHYSVTEDRFAAYMDDIAAEAERAREQIALHQDVIGDRDDVEVARASVQVDHFAHRQASVAPPRVHMKVAKQKRFVSRHVNRLLKNIRLRTEGTGLKAHTRPYPQP